MSKFFTNQDKNTLLNKLSGVFTHNKSIRFFDVLVGYFRASGYFKIRPLLNDIDRIRILVGIDVDKISADMHRQGLLFKANNEAVVSQWQLDFAADVKQANYEQEIEQGILQFIQDIQNDKVQLKAHPSRKIHAKIYIFRPDDFNEHNTGSVITGSSNLTESGLGTKTDSNYEFNTLLNDYADVKFASNEFENLWNEGVDILPDVVQSSLDQTHLTDAITPYELYLKCLIEYFGSEIEFDPNSIKGLPDGFKRLSYQMDAVNQGLEMLKKHNGFFLSDVVGLGKTVVATLIAREFYYHNDYPNYRSKILLIIPPALTQNWEDTLQSFKIDDAFSIITNGSLNGITDAKKYDMVIVDEAHKFRNDTAGAYDQLQRICKTKTTANRAKKVILVSATPLNNRPDDLYNQILLFQDGNNSTLDFPLATFFIGVKKDYKRILGLADKHKASKQTAELYEQIRKKVITQLMVRRTRTDLSESDRYKKDLIKHGITFPKTAPPQPIYYQLEPELERLYDSTIAKIDNKDQKKSGLLYTRYRALHYLKPEVRQDYQNTDFITERLVAIMKTLLLKRMDSSFYAFKQTLARFIKSSAAMLKMIANNKIIIAKELPVAEYILDDKEDELLTLVANKSLTDQKITVRTKDDFEEGFITGVEHDYQLLTTLQSDWDKITDDPKINEFLKQLPNFLATKNNPEQKLIIFTESADTMRYLTKQIKSTEYADKTLSINAQNCNKDKQKTITNNFDANISPDKKKNAYQLIITTDVLAEGINLHRANTVINYDIPWNATKLMQRSGRVNRIGQKAECIFVYNFYPTAQINDDIGLEKRAIIKLQAFHSALGGDSQVYSTDEKVETFGIFDENIKEEKNQAISFLEEIRKFRKNHSEDYKRIKDMPNKVRNAVKNTEHKNGTIVFARTDDKGSSRFYLVKDTVENYGFIKTVELLKCTPDTKPAPLHEQHHTQVLSALREFEDEIEQNIIAQTQNKSLSPQESKAINFLKSIINLPETNADEHKNLKLAVKQIEHKRFQKLTKEINKLTKNIKNIKPVVVLERTLNIIKSYDVNSHIEAESNPEPSSKNTKPTIVISQSYV